MTANRGRVIRVARRAGRYDPADAPDALRAASDAARIASRDAESAGEIGVAVAVIDALHGAGGVAQSADRIDAVIRNRAIRREFNGRNHRDLARRHGVSVRTVRRVVSRRKGGGDE